MRITPVTPSETCHRLDFLPYNSLLSHCSHYLLVLCPPIPIVPPVLCLCPPVLCPFPIVPSLFIVPTMPSHYPSIVPLSGIVLTIPLSYCSIVLPYHCPYSIYTVASSSQLSSWKSSNLPVSSLGCISTFCELVCSDLWLCIQHLPVGFMP
jgi:hypothetical protein